MATFFTRVALYRCYNQFGLLTGKELYYIAQAHFSGRLAGDGIFTKKCHQWLKERTGAGEVLLTHSCAGALELAALLLKLEPGDEVIMPSLAPVSSANPFVLRGAIPVFVDVREDTLNLDEKLVEQALTSRTKAILALHHGGIPCEMDTILSTAEKAGLVVVEHAPHAFLSEYKGRQVGSMGRLCAIDLYEPLEESAGEGGALLINDPSLVEMAEIHREKGTDRSRFFRGQVDKYTWQEVGSSFLPGEVIAAFMWAYLEHAEADSNARLALWTRYDALLQPLIKRGVPTTPRVSKEVAHNASVYLVQVENAEGVRNALAKEGIRLGLHYAPLHSSPAGIRYGRVSGTMCVTDRVASRLLRLPVCVGMKAEEQERVVLALTRLLL